MFPLFFVKKIKQKDNFTFTIEWDDGQLQSFRLSNLQKHCPCANCYENKSKQNEEVKAHKIVSVGRYALRIYFTEGCSKGIYSYEQLRQIGELI